MKKLFSPILLAAVFLTASCKKDQEPTPATPVINSFSPTEGAPGTQVTISGSNFGATAPENQVTFGTVSATIVSASSTEIKVTVPGGAVTAPISITVGNQTVTSLASFTVPLSPTITSFTPQKGIVGDEVTITGTHFGAVAANVSVKFGAVSATPTSVSDTQLKVKVPASASSDKITVTVGSQSVVSENTFSVLLVPVITSISPTKGFTGDVLTITGSNFSTDGSQNKVLFGVNEFPVISSTATELKVNIPEGASDGSVIVSVSGVKSAASPSLDVLNQFSVTSLAGGGSSNAGFVDATGSSARFTLPSGIALDASGNLLVAEGLNSAIRKVTSAGVVTTFAGSSTSGTNDGTGASAQFLSPAVITKDASGNFFVGDYNRVRKMTAGGVVTAFAGSGTSGYVNGNGTAAQFRSISGMVFDSNGNLYVADASDYRIRKITPAGDVTTFAGSGSYGTADGVGTAASFASLSGMAIDGDNNIYVIDVPRIRKIKPDGTVTVYAGSTTSGYANGSLADARFSTNVTSLVFGPRNDLYVVDRGNSRIRRITPQGIVSSFLGTDQPGFADGGQNEARFLNPFGIVFDSNGVIYITDSYNNLIRKVTIQ